MTDLRARWRRAAGRLLDERGRGLALLLAALLMLYAVVVVRTAWVSDDAFITLRTVDNAVSGHGLRWNVAERVQTYTHPLWMLLVLPLHALAREPLFSLLVPAIACSLGAAALLAFGRGHSRRSAVVVLCALIGSRALVDYSTSGLENPLGHLLVVGLGLVLARETLSARQLAVAGWLAGLCVLNRMDAVLLVAPPVLWVAWSERRDLRRVGALASGALPLVAWELFATLYYGSPLPNTAPAKLGTGLPALELAGQGLRYLAHTVMHDPVTLGGILLGLATAAACATPRRLAWGLGIVLYVLYVVKIGGDFMAGRMLTLPFVAALALFARAGHALPLRGARGWALGLVLVLSLLTTRPPLPSGADYGEDRRDLITDSGISDERRYYFPVGGWLVNTTAAGRPTPSSPQLQRGRFAAESGSPVLVEGAVGFAGYAAGPNVHVVDYHGLGDPLLSRLPAVRDPDGGWRVGHFERAIPAGYLTSVVTGENRIADPALRALYDEVRLLTRGPLLDGRRLLLVLRGLLGGPALDDAAAAPAPVPWDELLAFPAAEPLARYELARQARAEGRLEQAASEAGLSLLLYPDGVPALVEAADIASRAGRLPDAAAHLRRAIELSPEFGEAHYRMGEVLLRRGFHQAAVDAFRRALACDQGLAAAHANIGLALAQSGAPAEAVTALLEALRRVDDPAPVYRNLAGAFLQLGRRAAAFEALSRAVDAYREQGDEDTAAELEQRLRSLSH